MRIAYKKVNPSGIPDEYTELEYIGIGNNTTSYIDTNIWQTADGKESTTTAPQYIDTEIIVAYTGNASTRRLIGGSGYKTNYIGLSASNYFEAGGSNTSTVKASLNTKYRVTSHQTSTTFDFSVYNASGTLLGGKYGYTDFSGWDVTKAGASGHEANSTYNLFRIANWGSNYNSIYTQIYVARYWIDGVLVGEFYPCKRNSDNTIGMYDTVTKAFFTNSGTGSFTSGSEVTNTSKPMLVYTSNLPKEYQELDCIENTSGKYSDTGGAAPSNVGSYINTGINPTPNGIVKMKLQIADATGYTDPYVCLFGGYDSNTKNFGIVTQPSKTYFLDGGQTNISATWNYDGSTDYEIEYSATGKYLIQNGIKTTFSISGLSTTSDLSIYLFTNNATGSLSTFDTTYTLKGKIYYFQYYEGTELKMDLVPAVRKSDSVAGMYDKIQDKFFTNVGNGTFSYG